MITIEIKDLDKFLIKVKSLEKYDATKPLQKVGLEIENQAKFNCPVGEGALRRSITSEVENNELHVGTNMEYAPYVEYGTGIFASDGNGRQTPWSYQSADGEWHTTQGQQAQPFLLPAFNKHKLKVLDYIQQDIIGKIKE